MEQHLISSSRDTLDEAVVYGVDLLNTLPSEHRMTAFTAFHVLANTAIKLQEPAMRNLTPDWYSPGKNLDDEHTQAELFQQLRDQVAPLTYSVIKALDRAEERGMVGGMLFTPTGGGLLKRICRLLSLLSGLDRKAHEQEVEDFHDLVEKAVPKTPEELLAFLVKTRGSRG